MKTTEQIIEAQLKAYRSTLKLRVVDHRDRPNATNSFMITSGTEKNPTAFIVGGIRTYIPAGQMDRLCFPSIFKSRGSAQRHIEADAWYRVLIDDRVTSFEAKLRNS